MGVILMDNVENGLTLILEWLFCINRELGRVVGLKKVKEEAARSFSLSSANPF